MANRLTMAKIQAILSLHEQGWRNREIARELDVDRESVAKYVRARQLRSKTSQSAHRLGGDARAGHRASGKPGPLAEPSGNEKGRSRRRQSSPLSDVPPGNSKPAKAPIGSSSPSSQNQPKRPSGRSPFLTLAIRLNRPLSWWRVSRFRRRQFPRRRRAVAAPASPIGRSSWRSWSWASRPSGSTRTWFPKGSTTSTTACGGSWPSCEGHSPLPFRRMECEAGEEAQVDFGTGAWIELPDGKRRKSHVFRIVLSLQPQGIQRGGLSPDHRGLHSVHRECLLAFRRRAEGPGDRQPQSGGPTARTGTIPDLNPKIQSFCEHYGVVILPTKPRTPRHKGKIESGVGYVQDNGLKGHRFTSLEAENDHLWRWETTVADTRLHGTIRKQVGKLFQEVERGGTEAAAGRAVPILP